MFFDKFTITRAKRSEKFVNYAKKTNPKTFFLKFCRAFAMLNKKRTDEEGQTMTLDEVQAGGRVRITAVGGEGMLRCRLLDMGLIPQTLVSVTKVAPMGDPMELLLRGYSLTLRKEDARSITVEVEQR